MVNFVIIVTFHHVCWLCGAIGKYQYWQHCI